MGGMGMEGRGGMRMVGGRMGVLMGGERRLGELGGRRRVVRIWWAMG